MQFSLPWLKTIIVLRKNKNCTPWIGVQINKEIWYLFYIIAQNKITKVCTYESSICLYFTSLPNVGSTNVLSWYQKLTFKYQMIISSTVVTASSKGWKTKKVNHFMIIKLSLFLMSRIGLCHQIDINDEIFQIPVHIFRINLVTSHT